MAAHGEVKGYPRLDAAIFADTQAEPASVYSWLDWLEAEIQTLPFAFPIYRVTRGSLTEDQLQIKTAKAGHKYAKALIPAYVKAPDGSYGLFGRRCTADYKVAVILKKQRELAKVPRGCKKPIVTSWIGISRDEIYRMKPSREPWAENVWPLVELGMRRETCLAWMQNHGYPEPPRSACVYCPFHSDFEWLRLKTEYPEEFEKSVEFEKNLQAITAMSEGPGILRGIPYLHKSLVPLDTVVFKGDPGHGQLDLFQNECEGMCGV